MQTEFLFRDCQYLRIPCFHQRCFEDNSWSSGFRWFRICYTCIEKEVNGNSISLWAPTARECLLLLWILIGCNLQNEALPVNCVQTCSRRKYADSNNFGTVFCHAVAEKYFHLYQLPLHLLRNRRSNQWPYVAAFRHHLRLQSYFWFRCQASNNAAKHTWNILGADTLPSRYVGQCMRGWQILRMNARIRMIWPDSASHKRRAGIELIS